MMVCKCALSSLFSFSTKFGPNSRVAADMRGMDYGTFYFLVIFEDFLEFLEKLVHFEKRYQQK